jgi:hypothetical protein
MSLNVMKCQHKLQITRFWWGNLRERCYFEDLSINGSMILKRVLKKSVERLWTEMDLRFP